MASWKAVKSFAKPNRHVPTLSSYDSQKEHEHTNRQFVVSSTTVTVEYFDLVCIDGGQIGLSIDARETVIFI